MNHIYKIIWSKARHQYVVASELAKSVTKGAGSRAGKAAAAVLAAVVLTAGAGMVAQAGDLNFTVSGNTENDDKFIVVDHKHHFSADVNITESQLTTALEGTALKLSEDTTIGGSHVVTRAELGGYVTWENGDRNSIHGVKLENGKVTATEGAIGGVGLKDGKVTGLTAGTAETDAVNVKQMTDADDTTLNNAKNYTDGQMDGVVKWDQKLDEYDQPIEGEYEEGTINGVTFDEGRITGSNLFIDNGTLGTVKIEYGTITTTGNGKSTIGGVTFQEGKVGADSIQVGDSSNPAETTRIDGAAVSTGEIYGGYVDGNYTFHAAKDGTTTFGAGNDDKTVISGGSITTNTITAGDGNFTVDEEGNLKAAGGIVSGTIEAKSGDTAEGSLALGEGSYVSGNNSIAIGAGAQATSSNATAVGTKSHASGNHSAAFGNQSSASAEAALALGYNTSAKAENSVALGAGSIANEANTISVGRYDKDSPQYNFTRRITNVSAGINDTDAATVGQLKNTVDTATEGMVQWDSTTDGEGNTTYLDGENGTTATLKGVEFTGEGDMTAADLTAGTLNAASGAVKVDADGNFWAASGAFRVDADGTTYANAGQSQLQVRDDLAALSHGTNGVLANDTGVHIAGGFYAGNDLFHVAEDGSFATANGAFSVTSDGELSVGFGKATINKYGVITASNMYIGDASNEGNRVVTKNELNQTVTGAVGEATEGMVKWDKDESGNLTNSINGVGLEDGKVTADEITADKGTIGGVEFGGNGTINAAGGNFTVDESGNTSIGGDLEVAGDLTLKDGQGGYVNVGESITSIKDSIADVAGDISGVKENVAQNAADISGIKTEIGVNADGSYKTIDNGAEDIISGINQNAAAIGENKTAISGIQSQIGGTGENGALKLENGATTIEGGINANTAMIQNQGSAINALGDRMSDLGGEIDNVGAISAALAGLHPLDYDGTGSKFQLAAAMGDYDGSQAAAIGGFYHFNEDVMMSVGGATAFDGDKKTAFNVGVSFRVGQGSSGKRMNQDEVMAKLEAMEQKMQEMDAKIAALEEDKAALSEENEQLKAAAAEAPAEAE